MKNRKSIPLIIYLVVLATAFTWLSSIFTPSGNTIPYSQVVDMFEQEQVKSFVVQGDTLTMTLHTPINDKSSVVTSLADPEGFRLEMKDLLREQGGHSRENQRQEYCQPDGQIEGFPNLFLIVGAPVLGGQHQNGHGGHDGEPVQAEMLGEQGSDVHHLAGGAGGQAQNKVQGAGQQESGDTGAHHLLPRG